VPSSIVVGRGLHAPWNEGTRVIARNIGAAIRDAGHESQTISLSNSATFKVTDQPPSLVRHIPSHISSRASLAAISDYRYLLRTAHAIRTTETSSESRVYHLVNLPLALALLVRKPRQRVVAHVTFSRQIYSPPIERLRAGMGWRIFGRWVDAYACTSEQIRRDLVRRGYDPRKLHVVPPPIDLQLFRDAGCSDARRQLGWDPAAFVVLYIGTVSPLRFPAPDVLEALRLAVPDVPGLALKVFAPVATHDYNIAWADDNVRRAAQGATIPVGVNLEDLSEERKVLLYSAADVVILPFMAPVAVEPPLTLLEAMACQAAVAVAPAANRSAIVDDGVNGTLYSSSPELATCLKRLFDMGPSGRAALGRAARATIARRYSFDATARAIEAMWLAMGLRRDQPLDATERSMVTE